MRRAFALAFRILRHRQDAEDLVQDAFCQALVQIHTIHEGRPFGPWFCRMLINLGVNARERRSRRETEPLLDSAPTLATEPDAEGAEWRERFAQAVHALPDRQRLIVELFDVEGYSGDEIAEMLGITSGTVRWHLHQARAALRHVLAPLHGGHDA